ncbi:hypothetical protein BH09SUM1_BH09SUM1_06660 [soil metagenome]
MAVISASDQRLLDLLHDDDLITKAQQTRLYASLKRGMPLSEAIIKTPLVDPAKYTVMAEQAAKEASFEETDREIPPIVNSSPIPESKAVAPEPPPPTAAAVEEAKELMEEKFQAPQGTDLDDELDLGDDFMMPDDAASGDVLAKDANTDLDDDFIFPDDEVTPLPIPPPAASKKAARNSKDAVPKLPEKPPAASTPASTAALEEAFARERLAHAKATGAIPLVFPPKLHSVDPSIYSLGRKQVATYDLTHDEGIDLIAKVNDLLGEALMAERRGILIDLSKTGKNAGLYDPKGALEEEREIPKEIVEKMANRIRMMSKTPAPTTDARRGQCILTFDGEKSRALVETQLVDGKELLVIHLAPE